ncbi:MAG: 2OG-Fe(II) oxygenase [Pseudomonadota bacterium]
MSAPVMPFDPETLLLDTDAAKDAAKSRAEAYQGAAPYPHTCIDNFLPPEILERVRAELEDLPDAETSFSRAQENLKTSYIPERLPTYTRQLFYALNSRPFLMFLENMTGIKGLISDPFFVGGGVHKVGNGGHLDIHADFNYHAPLNLERRINVLIYLNKDWREEWGGSFEVWNKEMTEKCASFVPVFNRMCCFSTASDTFHGNPEKVNHPEGEPRMSLALYYYTATWDDSRKAHSTLFKPRPGTLDEVDRSEARRAFVADLVPPIIYRRIAHRLHRIGL